MTRLRHVAPLTALAVAGMTVTALAFGDQLLRGRAQGVVNSDSGVFPPPEDALVKAEERAAFGPLRPLPNPRPKPNPQPQPQIQPQPNPGPGGMAGMSGGGMTGKGGGGMAGMAGMSGGGMAGISGFGGGNNLGFRGDTPPNNQPPMINRRKPPPDWKPPGNWAAEKMKGTWNTKRQGWPAITFDRGGTWTNAAGDKGWWSLQRTTADDEKDGARVVLIEPDSKNPEAFVRTPARGLYWGADVGVPDQLTFTTTDTGQQTTYSKRSRGFVPSDK